MDVQTMMKESPLTFGEVARLRRVDLATVHRWRMGVKSSTGGILKLEAIRQGGRWATSREALERFLTALTAAFDRGERPGEEAEPEPRPRSPAERQAASEAAARQLASIGV